jgi:hypothetical protein
MADRAPPRGVAIGMGEPRAAARNRKRGRHRRAVVSHRQAEPPGCFTNLANPGADRPRDTCRLTSGSQARRELGISDHERAGHRATAGARRVCAFEVLGSWPRQFHTTRKRIGEPGRDAWSSPNSRRSRDRVLERRRRDHAGTSDEVVRKHLVQGPARRLTVSRHRPGQQLRSHDGHQASTQACHRRGDRSTAVASCRSSSAAEIAPRHSPITDSRERQREVSRSRATRSASHRTSRAFAVRRSANRLSRSQPPRTADSTQPARRRTSPSSSVATASKASTTRCMPCSAMSCWAAVGVTPRTARRCRASRSEVELDLQAQVAGAHRPTIRHQPHAQPRRAGAAPAPSTGRPSNKYETSTRLLIAIATTALRTSLTSHSLTGPEFRAANRCGPRAHR